MAVIYKASEDLVKQICKAAGIEYGQCMRLILDIDASRLVKIYASTFVTDEILKLDWKIGLTKIETE